MIRLILKYLGVFLAASALLSAIVFGILALSNWRRTGRVLASNPVSIPAGTFFMGCANGDDKCGGDEPPARPVNLGAFKIDRFPVTNAAYRQCVEAGACPLPHVPEGLGGFWDALKPVTGVTWKEAENYCTWRGGWLPSEAQWERAARGTTTAIWPWGQGFSAENVCAGIPPRRRDGPCPVDRFPQGASSEGVREMAGNVWEWTADNYRPSSSPRAPLPDQPGPGPEDRRVLKGGSWMERESASLRISKRNAAAENSAAYNAGFRCAYP
ncbi:MAG TPA: SUMF1/EgtB/PvdO family nonheme iron enzyme [bacterium]|nr:SUMF1/EgtB/PvdO family nonheme iron enzyme [bacterium]